MCYWEILYDLTYKVTPTCLDGYYWEGWTLPHIWAYTVIKRKIPFC